MYARRLHSTIQEGTNINQTIVVRTNRTEEAKVKFKKDNAHQQGHRTGTLKERIELDVIALAANKINTM